MCVLSGVCISGYFERAVAIGPFKTLLYLCAAYQEAKNSSCTKMNNETVLLCKHIDNHLSSFSDPTV